MLSRRCHFVLVYAWDWIIKWFGQGLLWTLLLVLDEDYVIAEMHRLWFWWVWAWGAISEECWRRLCWGRRERRWWCLKLFRCLLRSCSWWSHGVWSLTWQSNLSQLHLLVLYDWLFILPSLYWLLCSLDLHVHCIFSWRNFSLVWLLYYDWDFATCLLCWLSIICLLSLRKFCRLSDQLGASFFVKHGWRKSTSGFDFLLSIWSLFLDLFASWLLSRLGFRTGCFTVVFDALKLRCFSFDRLQFFPSLL